MKFNSLNDRSFCMKTERFSSLAQTLLVFIVEHVGYSYTSIQWLGLLDAVSINSCLSEIFLNSFHSAA